MILFVQQSKTKNRPTIRFSLFVSGQGLTAISEYDAIHFFGTVRATRPIDREILCSEANARTYDSRLRGDDAFMIDDLKAEARVMSRRVTTSRCPVPFRQRSQFARPEESVGQAGTPNAKNCVWEPDPPYARVHCAKQTQFSPLGRQGPWEGKSCDIASMPRFGKQSQFRQQPCDG